MHQIDDAIIKGGRLVLSDLPFTDGQHVCVIVAEQNAPRKTASIHVIRQLLKDGVERFDDPFEPLIPPNGWEMLK